VDTDTKEKDQDFEFIEDDESWMHRTGEVVEVMRTILRDKLSTRLEKLEAGRIIAACCGILVPEGLLHKTTNNIMDEHRRKEIERTLFNELFRDRQRTNLKQKKYALQKKLKRVEDGELLFHPKVVQGLKIELRRINTSLNNTKYKKKKIDEKLILASTEESTANILAAFESIEAQGGADDGITVI
jgi:hypothetical protein